MNYRDPRKTEYKFVTRDENNRDLDNRLLQFKR